MYKFEGDNFKSANELCISVTVTKHQFPKDRRKIKAAREKAPRVKVLKSALVRGRNIAVRKGKNPIGRAHIAPNMKLRNMVKFFHLFFLFFFLRQMGKNKALALHTSTYFRKRRVSI